jgi:hypothetical protein
MTESKEARNKALVLKAFDTLFNKRDYAAAEHFWSRFSTLSRSGKKPMARSPGIWSLTPSSPPTPISSASMRWASPS